MHDTEFIPRNAPPPHERMSLFEESSKKAHQHKWIESEKAGRDLGDGAIADWHTRYWRTFCRECYIEHLQGARFWMELDAGNFGLLNHKFHHNTELVHEIVEILKQGGENLDVITWAVEHDIPAGDVLKVLQILDINARRLAPAIDIDSGEFVASLKARHRVRALLVDDDKDTLDVLHRLVSSEGMDTVCVMSGEAALDEVKTRRFDLFFIDIMLPGKHGAEIAWYLRRHGVSAPILAISAVLDAWDEDDLYDCGFTSLLGKPFDMEQITQIVRDVLRVHEGDSL